MKKLINSSKSINIVLSKNSMTIFFITTFLLYSIISLGQAKEKWTLKRDKDGIKVYIRIEPITGLPEYKGITKIAAPLASIEAVLRDVEEYPKLFPGTKTAKLLQSDEGHQICYMTNECPFPFSDRDGIYQSDFYFDSISDITTIRIIALPDYLPKYSDKVRITTSKGFWTLKPLTDGTIEVVYQQYADPGGNFPIWMIKLYSVNIPFKALKCLLRQVQLSKYQTLNNEMVMLDTQ
jgi:hypothetical protein